MKTPKIDFLSPQNNSRFKENFEQTPPKRWKPKRRVLFFFVAAVGMGGVVFSFYTPRGFDAASSNAKSTNIFRSVSGLLRSGERQLFGENENRINVLILGIGGVGHDGPNLTDTIILASIDQSEHRLAFLSIPRDLVVPTVKYGEKKINAVNALAESERPGTGGEVASQVLESVLGERIHYYIRVDFSGFKKFIDEIGGISVFVENSFSDSFFPDAEGKTKTISFTRGFQEMNGEQALEYARSRHGTNGEGTDFARSRRQQIILRAVRDKLLSRDMLINLYGTARAVSNLSNHVQTNLELWQAARLGRLAQTISRENIFSRVIEAGEGGLLKEIIAADGAYILAPKRNNWDRVRYFVANIFEPNPFPARMRVEIQNGTRVMGLAALAAKQVGDLGYEVVKVGNALKQNEPLTTIYDLTNGTRPKELDELVRNFPQAIISVSPPGWLTASLSPQKIRVQDGAPKAAAADFLIVLGRDQAN